jgi:hypothetical protein
VTFADVGTQACPVLLDTPTVAKLIKRVKPGSFDFVLITTHIANECMFGFVNKIKAPFGYFFSAGDLPWSSGAVGNPLQTSFVPYMAATFGDRSGYEQILKQDPHAYFKPQIKHPNLTLSNLIQPI